MIATRIEAHEDVTGEDRCQQAVDAPRMPAGFAETRTKTGETLPFKIGLGHDFSSGARFRNMPDA